MSTALALPDRPRPEPTSATVRHLTSNGLPISSITRTWGEHPAGCDRCPSGTCSAKLDGLANEYRCSVRVEGSHVPQEEAAGFRMAGPSSRQLGPPGDTPGPSPAPVSPVGNTPSPAVAPIGADRTYLGVTPTPDGRFRASMVNAIGEPHDLGEYDTAAQAAQARDDGVFWEHGSKATLNFDRHPEPPRCPDCGGQVGKTGRCYHCQPGGKRKAARPPGAPARRSATGYRGVKANPNGTFYAYFKHERREVGCGTWTTAERAARARDAKVVELGTGAELNFPAEHPGYVARNAVSVGPDGRVVRGMPAAPAPAALLRRDAEQKPRAPEPSPGGKIPTGAAATPAAGLALRQRAQHLLTLADLIDAIGPAEARALFSEALAECGS